MVMICDNYLQIKEAGGNEEAKRFFRMASQLPMELQMILARYSCGSSKTLIMSGQAENSFKELFRLFFLASEFTE